MAAIEKLRHPERLPIPTFSHWFEGRFWSEHVLGNARGGNKESTKESKQSIYRTHLKPFFGHLTLDKIDLALINTFRARLRAPADDGWRRKEKTINGILTVLSKALNYAAEVRVIERAPTVGIVKTERPEPKFYEWAEWAKLLRAVDDQNDRIATLLAGDHGLRVGEIRALRMREDVDMKSRTITINQAVFEVTDRDTDETRDVFDTPKGRTRRTIPMSAELYGLLRNRLPVGYVVIGTADGPDGKHLTFGEARWIMQRACRRAGLAEINRYGAWHVLRHTFATHAAYLGVNPWTLNQWMGHKTMEETLGYVALAKTRPRPIPEGIVAAGADVADPDRRIRAQLDARGSVEVAADKKAKKKS